MIVPLRADTVAEPARLGGKGAGLVRLLRAGLAVPDVWCIPADATGSETDELGDLWRSLGPGARVAVRSSSVVEDLGRGSLAGVFETHLDVASERALREAVAACRASATSARARAHTPDARMAILIQRMLDPTTAGVLLTVNPRRPLAEEILIEAVLGQGEALVSGRAQPDGWVLDRNTGDVLSRRIGEKEIEITWNGSGVHAERSVAAERRSAPCLGAPEIVKLFELARTVEARIGPALDVEWAIADGQLWALQARPIVGLPPRRPRVIHSRKFGDEYLADYTTPLGHTLLTRWISEDYMREMALSTGNPAAAEVEPILRHKGYAYINGEYIARTMRAIPRSLRTLDSIDWFPPAWDERVEEEPFSVVTMLRTLLAPYRDPRGSIAANPAAMERHAAEVERRIAPLLCQDYGALDDVAWRRQLDEAYEIGREHFRIIRWGMGFWSPLLHGSLKSCLASWAADSDGALYAAAIGGLSGTHTAAIARDVIALAALARADAALTAAILSGTPLDRVRAEHAGSAFLVGFDRFIADHGHRAGTREISQPRWRETPDVVLGFVRAHLAGEARDPAEAEQRSVQRRLEAVELAVARARRGASGRVRAQVLAWLLRWAEVYTRYRENQRYYLDYLLFHVRLLVLERGRRLAARGVLPDTQDVFLLDAQDLFRDAPTPDLPSRLDKRRIELARFRHRMPAAYLYDGVEVDEGDDAVAAEPGAFSGLGAAPGRVRGTLRLIASLDALGDVEPGDILVTSNTDPGWTTVFPLLGGLVTETGGMLSHGALLAREYGIPAVTGVRHAMSLLETGRAAEIDGGRGTVRLV